MHADFMNPSLFNISDGMIPTDPLLWPTLDGSFHNDLHLFDPDIGFL